MTNAAGVPTLIANARLADGRVVDVTVDDGVISQVCEVAGERVEPAGEVEGEPIAHDLDEWLVLPAMAEPHAHIDKALTADLVPNPTGDLMGAIDGWVGAVEQGIITAEGIAERAIAAIELALVHGVTAMRTHVNVVAPNATVALNAVHEAARRFEGVVDLQIVALVGHPLTGREGAPSRAALGEALEVGVDLIGGCPHLDPDPGAMLSLVFDAADEAGLGLDLHVDETLDSTMLTLRDYAQMVIDRGFEHMTTAGHCVTLGMQTPKVQAEIAQLVAEASMAVVPLPATNLFLQGREYQTARPRGLTAVEALVDAGVLVVAGGDNVQDPFNLVGRGDPLETAALMVMAAHQLPDDAYDMVSNRARRAMGLDPVNFRVGDPADFLAIDASTVRAAVAGAPMSRRVFRGGRLVARCDHHSHVLS